MYAALLFCLSKRVFIMNRLEHVVAMLDKTLGTKSKRHIMGGILVSAALLFGGLAFTVMTIKSEDKTENEQ